MKKMVSLFLVLVLLIAAPVSVFASSPYPDGFEESKDITYLTKEEVQQIDGLSVWYPLQDWSYTQSIINGMTISGNTAKVVCDVQAYSTTTKIYATNTLQRYSGGWVDVKSWSGSGTFYCSFSGSTSISSGQMYRVVTEANLYSASGAFLETATATSRVYTT